MLGRRFVDVNGPGDLVGGSRTIVAIVHGWLRATIYLFAASYGWMLGSAFSDWFRKVRDGNQHRIRLPRAEMAFAAPPDIPFVWPGPAPQDWVRPAINLAEVLVLILLGLVLFSLLRGKLAEARPTTLRKGHFGLSWLFAVTTVAAGLLAWVRVLTRMTEPMHHYWSGKPVTVAMADLLGENIPIGMVTLAAAALVIIGWSGRWYHLLLAVATACIVTIAGDRIIDRADPAVAARRVSFQCAGRSNARTLAVCSGTIAGDTWHIRVGSGHGTAVLENRPD